MKPTIFTRIIRGEIPCYKIYEDDKVLAFLDIHPRHPGHTLVIPKVPIDHLWDLPDEDYQAVMMACKKVANRLREVLQPVRVGEQVVGVDVPHAHVHLFPFDSAETFLIVPDTNAPPDHEALAAMAKRLAF